MDERGYRLLAAAVLHGALVEAAARRGAEARRARAWCLAPSSAADRELWLAWLRLDDDVWRRRAQQFLDERL